MSLERYSGEPSWGSFLRFSIVGSASVELEISPIFEQYCRVVNVKEAEATQETALTSRVAKLFHTMVTMPSLGLERLKTLQSRGHEEALVAIISVGF